MPDRSVSCTCQIDRSVGVSGQLHMPDRSVSGCQIEISCRSTYVDTPGHHKQIGQRSAADVHSELRIRSLRNSSHSRSQSQSSQSSQIMDADNLLELSTDITEDGVKTISYLNIQAYWLTRKCCYPQTGDLSGPRVSASQPHVSASLLAGSAATSRMKQPHVSATSR